MSSPRRQTVLSAHTHLTEVLSQSGVRLLLSLFSINPRPGVLGLCGVSVPRLGAGAASYPGDRRLGGFFIPAGPGPVHSYTC